MAYSFPMEPTYCPHCGMIVRSTSTNFQKYSLKNGETGICVGCHKPAIFKDGRLFKLSEEDIKKLDPYQREKLENTRAEATMEPKKTGAPKVGLA